MSSVLSHKIQSHVRIGRISINGQGRVMIDGISVRDRQEVMLLYAHRVAAKMEWIPLITEGRIAIANAQILSARVNVYHLPDSTLNMQYLIDAFSSPDRKSSFPLDLHIGSLIIRRSAVQWDSLSVSSINMTAHLHRLTNDSISLSLKRLSLDEGHGGVLHNLVVDAHATRHSILLRTLSLDGTLPALPHFPEKTDIHIDASGDEQRMDITRLEAKSPLYSLSLLADGYVENILQKPSIHAHIKTWSASNLPDALKAIGEVDTQGSIESDLHNHRISLHSGTAIGSLALEGTLTDNNDFSVSLSTDTLRVSPLTIGTKASTLHKAILSLNADGRIKGVDGLPEARLSLQVPFIQFHKYALQNLRCNAERQSRDTDVEAHITDPIGSLAAHLHVDNDRWTLAEVDAVIEDFAWNREGDDIVMPPTDIRLSHHITDGIRHFSLLSDNVSLEASGTLEDSIDFAFAFSDTLLLRKFAGIDLGVPQQGMIVGRVSPSPSLQIHKSRISSRMEIPVLTYGNEKFSNTQIDLSYSPDALETNLFTEREMPLGNTALTLNVGGTMERLRGVLSWDNRRTPLQRGELDATVLLGKDSTGCRDVRLWIAPSDVVINDTAWHVHPATVHLHNNIIDVQGIHVSEHERTVSANGRISASETDTLRATFNDVNVAYVMDLVKFHSVLFGGNASGEVVLTGLMKQPVVDARAHVKDFTFNNTPEGACDAHLVWGRSPNTLDIEGYVYDKHNDMETTVSGLVVPGRRPDSRLHLDINTRNFGLGFLNFFTQGILEDIDGRTTGRAIVGGPMGHIDLSGRLRLNSLSLRVPYTGVKYHLDGVGEDSVILRPGHIIVQNAHLMDEKGHAASGDHYGILQGHMQHRYFQNLTYDFHADAHRLLAYDMRNFDEQPFYGTLLATGDIRIFGGKGHLQVDAALTPAKGSSLTYSISNPGDVTKSDFITYVNHSPTALSDDKTTAQNITTAQTDLSHIGTDIRVNLDMNMTPDMRLRVLMDQKTGDILEVGGEGRLLANFYNKGRFNLYGTYRLTDGSYRLSFQDIIRKDFIFRRDGTIVFSGNPLLATMNMQAAYTVPNVSLNDLGSSSLGFNNTRVDCLMNISGRPASPIITFDFDLPNATEDEKRIVHSMVSTEEERNMQVIYLLGVGRFYSYAARGESSSGQTSTAMYSLMASTLSQRFNQLLGDAIGSNNWTFGANLRTGDTGWNNVDVEGMLSGRLFDNRLLVNGNFGYRESYYTTRNIITDIDVQYLLTQRGTVALRAYNKTNDRYFVQNSFNTQGIGIVFQKEFNRLRYLFRRSRLSK